MDVKKKNPDFRNFSMGLALAMSAFLTACGGGGGGDSSTPAPANDAAAATATSTAADTTAGNGQAANAQTTAPSGSGIYEKLRAQCPVMPTGTTEGGYYACAAGVYTGKSPKDGAGCTVKLTQDGNVTYTVGNKVHSFKMITGFSYAKSGPANAETQDAWFMLMSGASAEGASNVETFELDLQASGSKPDHMDIKYIRNLTTTDSTCRVPI